MVFFQKNRCLCVKIPSLQPKELEYNFFTFDNKLGVLCSIVQAVFKIVIGQFKTLPCKNIKFDFSDSIFLLTFFDSEVFLSRRKDVAPIFLCLILIYETLKTLFKLSWLAFVSTRRNYAEALISNSVEPHLEKNQNGWFGQVK